MGLSTATGRSWRAAPLPSYIRPLGDLTAHKTETVVCHFILLRRSDTSSSPRIARIDQPRAVTWLKFVHGSWLVAATSDSVTSLLRLWRLADVLERGSNARPVAKAFLPAPVRDDAVDVQSEDTDVAFRIAVSLYSE